MAGGAVWNQTWFEKTWPGRALDAAAFWCARVAGTSRRPARPEPRDGMGAHQWFLCAGLAVMLCIPHFWWDNLYGVAFSLAVLLTGWREAVRHGRCPLRPTALGPGCWLFLLMCLLATALAGDKAASARVALFYLAGFALTYTVASSFRTEASLNRLSAFLYGALLLTSLFGSLRVFLGPPRHHRHRLHPAWGAHLLPSLLHPGKPQQLRRGGGSAPAPVTGLGPVRSPERTPDPALRPAADPSGGTSGHLLPHRLGGPGAGAAALALAGTAPADPPPVGGRGPY